MTEQPESIVRRSRPPGSTSRPVTSALYPTVVFASADPDELDAQYEGRLAGFTYAREGHPNAVALASTLGWLEGAEHPGVVTGSGMAAVAATLLGLLEAGDHVLGADQLYGRSHRMLTDDLPRLGFQTSLADPTDVGSIEAALRPNTRALLVETVSNPTLRVADLDGIADLATDRAILLVVDNTFTTPRAIRPLEHGADVVIHSVTKILAGHSDATLGFAAARDADVQERLREAAVTWGLTPSPFDCWLAERGLHTFELRYDRAESTAAALADALAASDAVEAVFYPGRADHPDHDRARNLLGGRHGTMVGMRLKGGREIANKFIRAAAPIPFAPTLGDVSTLLSHPASSSHRRLSADDRRAMGITEGFIRISVGIEDPEILIPSLLGALGN
ncbi:MAG TPA: aminotransferase class I/II-fold pyridoxal phosphate-dependent enzyme [Acidimicrobiia bacterium]|nr:aminotransferase class I/II-fold pyridoxal phosphate-dependent enzyme [Acidimicrobiia bacterium]